MKMHFWERIEHRLHRHAPSATPPTPPPPAGVPHAELHGRERFESWLNRLARQLPYFDRPNDGDSSKPH